MATLAHALFVAGALLAAGAAFYGVHVVPRAQVAPRPVRRLVAAGIAAAAIGLAGWAAALAAVLGGSAASLPLLLGGTLFGHLAILQAAGLALAAALLTRGFALAAGPLALVLLAEAAHGHGGAMGGLVLAAGIVHLVAAAVWVGGLPPLLVAVGREPLPAAARAARFFSGPARIAVLAVAGSALVQAAILVGSPAALLRTRYGVLVLAKLALFTLLLAAALLNRYRFAPRLRGEGAGRARVVLARSVALQVAGGGAAIVVAVLLGGSAPGIDWRRS